MNSFGNSYRLSIFGESHGELVGVTLDGVRPGLELSVEDFAVDLKRRQGGSGLGTTPRKESDEPHLVTGILDGRTTGAPLTILFYNNNTRSKDYSALALQPRPSHSDWVAAQKYNGYNDLRGGGHFSARLTLGLVSAGVVAKKLLGEEVQFSTKVVEMGGQNSKFADLLRDVEGEHDSVGAVVECRVSGVGVGLGEPFFDSVEAVVAHLMFSVPGVKGVEFGAGFGASRMRGSEHNDTIITKEGETLTNNAGGVVGGISNGNEIVCRVAFKPTASIAREQQTFKYDSLDKESGSVESLQIEGRHDSCIAIRGVVVAEAAMAVALADLTLRA